MAEQLIEQIDRALDGKLTKGECRSLQFLAERWMSWIAAAIPTLIVSQVLIFTELIDNAVFPLYPMLMCIPLALGLDVILVILTLQWRNRTIYRRIMARLYQLNIRPRYCLVCEYNLKGACSDHCPECGTALAPVGEADTKRME